MSSTVTYEEPNYLISNCSVHEHATILLKIILCFYLFLNSRWGNTLQNCLLCYIFPAYWHANGASAPGQLLRDCEPVGHLRLLRHLRDRQGESSYVIWETVKVRIAMPSSFIKDETAKVRDPASSRILPRWEFLHHLGDRKVRARRLTRWGFLLHLGDRQVRVSAAC
jgi:hypothetical protein